MIAVITNLLDSLRKALDGLLSMSNELEDVILFNEAFQSYK